MSNLKEKRIESASFGLNLLIQRCFTFSGVSVRKPRKSTNIAERRTKMTRYKSRKAPARLGDSAWGLYVNRHGCAMPKNHEPPGSRVARPLDAGWLNCAILARAARSPYAQGHGYAAALGHCNLNAISMQFLWTLSLFFSEHF